MTYYFPLSANECPGIPINFHPGAFGFKRRQNYHSGVDLYCNDGEVIHPIESGIVVGTGIFTGPEVKTPWWNTTYYLMIQGNTGVFLYGEIYKPTLEIGDEIDASEFPTIGMVKQVLFNDKHREDIPYHSTSMLHLELYQHGTCEPVEWWDHPKPSHLLDPTPYIIYAYAQALKDRPANTIPKFLSKFLWDNSNGNTVG